MTNDAAPPNHSDSPIDWDALARYLAGESPAVEAEQIARWLAENPTDANVVAALDNALRIRVLRNLPGVDIEAALQTVSVRRDAPASARPTIAIHARSQRDALRMARKPWRVVSLLAAAAVVILAARAVLQRVTSVKAPAAASAGAKTYATGVGQRDSIRLPDGGRVILGPASRLTVAADYGQRLRQVELHGEAYFEIVHDTTRPFHVRVASAIIRDVGTAFVVRNDGVRVRVVVTSGSVLLRSMSDTTRQARLDAGDMGTVQSDGLLSKEQNVPTASYLGWLKGSLVFRDAPLAEVGADLRRWYGVVLRIDDSTLARRHLTMSFDGDSIGRVIRIIGLSLGADYELRGDTAIVRPRRNARPQ